LGDKHTMALIRSKHYGIIRCVIVAFAFLLQIALMILLALYLYRYSVMIYFVLEFISVVTVFALVNNAESYKMSWIIIILVMPVAGLVLYNQWGRKRTNSKYFKRLRNADNRMRENLIQDMSVAEELEKQHPNKVQISRYLRKEGFPIYKNTSAVYYEVGEDVINAMIADLKTAKKFIFMEYFIVSSGRVWDEILEILTQKVKEGVEVKLLFDDFGTVTINTYAFRKDIVARE
jgi:cardiolipin synthase